MILVLIYAGLVFIFGALLRNVLGQQQNPLVFVASTLVVAALIQPLRHSIRRVIDRRFYRRTYDAAKTVEAFSATLRNELYLNQLQEELLQVVQETMQPAHISLWLRPPQLTTKHQKASTSDPHECRGTDENVGDYLNAHRDNNEFSTRCRASFADHSWK